MWYPVLTACPLNTDFLGDSRGFYPVNSDTSVAPKRHTIFCSSEKSVQHSCYKSSCYPEVTGLTSISSWQSCNIFDIIQLLSRGDWFDIMLTPRNFSLKWDSFSVNLRNVWYKYTNPMLWSYLNLHPFPSLLGYIRVSCHIIIKLGHSSHSNYYYYYYIMNIMSNTVFWLAESEH